MEFKLISCEDYAEKYEKWIERAKRMHPRFKQNRNQGTAWAPLRKPLKDSRIALISTGGIHMKDQAAFDVVDPSGDWSYREIPASIPAGELKATHEHYDTDAANHDINVMFPIDALRTLVERGVVGESAPTHFGLMGFIPDSIHVVEELGPFLAERLKKDAVDAVVLSPG